MNTLTFLKKTMVEIVGESDEITSTMLYRDMYEIVEGVANYIMGYGIVIMLLLVSLTTVLDVMYLTIPVFKLTYDSKAQQKDSTFWNVVTFLLVSKHAKEAAEECSRTNVPVMWIYLKRSVGKFVLVTVVTVVLLRGLKLLVPIVARIIIGIL